MTALCFTDCETLSLRPGRQAWEIAVIRRDGGARDERVWIVVAQDLDLSQADPQSLEINGFYRRHPDMTGDATYGDSGPQYGAESWVMQDVEEWTRGGDIWGINPAFDMVTLEDRMRAHRMLPSWDYHPNDVRAMAIGWLNGLRAAGVFDKPIPRDMPANTAAGEYLRDKTWRYGGLELPRRTDELAEACGVDLPTDEERHTALGDARFAERWHDAMTGGAA